MRRCHRKTISHLRQSRPFPPHIEDSVPAQKAYICVPGFARRPRSVQVLHKHPPAIGAHSRCCAERLRGSLRRSGGQFHDANRKPAGTGPVRGEWGYCMGSQTYGLAKSISRAKKLPPKRGRELARQKPVLNSPELTPCHLAVLIWPVLTFAEFLRIFARKKPKETQYRRPGRGKMPTRTTAQGLQPHSTAYCHPGSHPARSIRQKSGW